LACSTPPTVACCLLVVLLAVIHNGMWMAVVLMFSGLAVEPNRAFLLTVTTFVV
jgi:general stress protein CsbA